jgi:hypothetical protein
LDALLYSGAILLVIQQLTKGLTVFIAQGIKYIVKWQATNPIRATYEREQVLTHTSSDVFQILGIFVGHF